MVGHFDVKTEPEPKLEPLRMIFSSLEHIQATTTLIHPTCNIWNDYDIQHSGRRFPIAHENKKGVKPHD